MLKKSEVLKEGYVRGLRAALNIIKRELNEDAMEDYLQSKRWVDGDPNDPINKKGHLNRWDSAAGATYRKSIAEMVKGKVIQFKYSTHDRMQLRTVIIISGGKPKKEGSENMGTERQEEDYKNFLLTAWDLDACDWRRFGAYTLLQAANDPATKIYDTDSVEDANGDTWFARPNQGVYGSWYSPQAQKRYQEKLEKRAAERERMRELMRQRS